MLTKEEFVDYLNFIKEQDKLQENFIKALEALSPETYCECFIYSEYSMRLINLLTRIMNDQDEDITYFIYDSDFGEVRSADGTVLYDSPESLYDYLVKKHTS